MFKKLETELYSFTFSFDVIAGPVFFISRAPQCFQGLLEARYQRNRKSSTIWTGGVMGKCGGVKRWWVVWPGAANKLANTKRDAI